LYYCVCFVQAFRLKRRGLQHPRRFFLCQCSTQHGSFFASFPSVTWECRFDRVAVCTASSAGRSRRRCHRLGHRKRQPHTNTPRTRPRHHIREVLLSCIQAEWQTPAEQEHVHEVLSKLSYAAPSLQSMVRDKVLNLRLQAEPLHEAVLTQALKLIFNQPVAQGQEALSQVAQQRLPTLAPDAPAFMTWLVIWLQLEANGAVAFLQSYLKTADNPDKFMEKLCAVLSGRFGYRHLMLKHPAYLQAERLETLIPLVYQHIRPEDDLHHEDGYSPVDRDEAQSFRGGLLPELARLATPEAYQVLTRLAEHPLLANKADWIAKLLRDNAELGAEEAAWKPQRVAEFAAQFEKNAHPEINIQNQYNIGRDMNIHGDMVCGDKVVQ